MKALLLRKSGFSTTPGLGSGHTRSQCLRRAQPRPFRNHSSLCRAQTKEQDTKPEKKEKKPDDEYIEALKKSGVDQKLAQTILQKWKETGADSDPNALRKLFLKQSLVPIAASVVQLLFDAAAAYSLFISANFFALGPQFFGRTIFVLLLDFLAIYFAIGLLFDIVTLISVLITTVKLNTSPVAFYNAVKAIAAPPGTNKEGLAIVEKAKSAVSAVKVAAALDAIANMLDTSSQTGKVPTAAAGGGEKGAALKSIDTLMNLSAYLTLYRAESQAGFDPTTIGMSAEEAANIALVFGQYDLDDNGRLDASEFRKMLQTLGADVAEAEAEAAMEVMDGDKDGFIGFEEFAKWWAARKSSQK